MLRTSRRLSVFGITMFAAALNLNLPVITGLVLKELQARLKAGFRRELPMPFYCQRDDDFTRELID